MMPTCLITGSAGRLGAALCRAFCSTHQIAAVYRNTQPPFPSQLRRPIVFEDSHQKTCSNLAFCVQGDLTRGEDLRRIVEVVLARFGRIDILINSAADTRFHGKLLDLSFGSEEVEYQLVTNCIAPVKLASAIFQEFWKDDQDGNREFNRCVVNISSISGLHVYPSAGQGFYSASKAALNFLTKHLANELADYGVRANAVCPTRFPDSVPTEAVVTRVLELTRSCANGEVVEVTRDAQS
jgi:NAD(P)-dependent dehydrogenase (short-subunit alcohol dehydrogenase family)